MKVPDETDDTVNIDDYDDGTPSPISSLPPVLICYDPAYSAGRSPYYLLEITGVAAIPHPGKSFATFPHCGEAKAYVLVHDREYYDNTIGLWYQTLHLKQVCLPNLEEYL